MKRLRSVFLVLVTSALIVFGSTIPVNASEIEVPEFPSDPIQAQWLALNDGLEGGVGGSASEVSLPDDPGAIGPLSQSIGGVYCTGTQMRPHFSNGANGTIFKVSVVCGGTAYTHVQVRIRGALSLSSAACPTCNAGPIVTRATSDETRNITVGGAAQIFYVPQIGSSGGYGTGFWYNTHTIQIVGPQVGSIGSQTEVIWLSVT